jgi:DNA polymerase III epsilon subunit-like protein
VATIWTEREPRVRSVPDAPLHSLRYVVLAKFYRVDVHDAHHALSDAFLTARVWQKMLYALQEKGNGNLRKPLKIGGA